MAFIHPQSCECAKSELDIFLVPPTQTSTESGAWLEYNPISSIAEGTPIEFSISGSGQDYFDLANTQLFVHAQIQRANNTPINNTDEVAPVNLFLHSLFSEVDVKLNDTLVSSTNNTYAYRAYLESLLSYGPAAKNSHLTSALYYKDIAGHMEDADPHDAQTLNTGLKSRHALIDAGRMIDMIGSIHSDIFMQEKYLPSDVSLRIRLVRTKNEFCLMSSVPVSAFKVKILECKIFVRKVKLSPSVFLAHAKALEVGKAKYPIRRIIVKSVTVPRGNLDYSGESIFSGQLPTRIVIALVDNR